MDTTFIIDSSGCVPRRNWILLLNFVQTLVNFFDVSPTGGRIALVQYSTNANVVLKFNTLTGNLLNGAEVNRQVSRLQCQRGFRRIDKAIKLAEKDVLTSAAGTRNVSRVNAFTVVICSVKPFPFQVECWNHIMCLQVLITPTKNLNVTIGL